MGIKQNQIGKHTEVDVAQFFKENQYWAFVIPKGINGQPFDIIARRRNKTFFIDAKHSDTGHFPFERIEPNQITSMSYANKVAEIKDNMGFVIKYEQELYFLPYETFVEMKNKGQKSVKIELLDKLEVLLGDQNAS